MKLSYTIGAFVVAAGVTACNQQDSESVATVESTAVIEEHLEIFKKVDSVE